MKTRAQGSLGKKNLTGRGTVDEWKVGLGICDYGKRKRDLMEENPVRYLT